MKLQNLTSHEALEERLMDLGREALQNLASHWPHRVKTTKNSTLDAILILDSQAKDPGEQLLVFGCQSEHAPAPIPIQEILSGALHISRSIIPADIDIQYDIQPDCPAVMSDPAEVNQIIMNLIFNAYQAVEQTGGEISVRLKETVLTSPEVVGLSLRPGRYAVLSVSDTGLCRNAAAIENNFESHINTEDRCKGSGLGFSIVYDLVKAHRGDMEVSSAIGKGTQVHIYLPIAKSASE